MAEAFRQVNLGIMDYSVGRIMRSFRPEQLLLLRVFVPMLLLNLLVR